MTLRLEVDRTGPAVSIQDQGRPGFARFGLSRGGAMDAWALAEGCALLGNSPRQGVIEMAGFGGRFRLHGGHTWAALCGAPMQATLDGRPVPWRSAFALSSGQLLDIGKVNDAGGTYGYLHIAGGFTLRPEIGAIGTHIRGRIGGIDGRPLQEGDILPLGAPAKIDQPCRLPAPDYLARRTLRILWSPQSSRFSDASRQRLLTETFCISHRRDRMAMRLKPLDDSTPFEGLLTGLSDPVQMGDIQMTGDGVPAIVMAEHQPTGGYPRIATVTSADLAAAAQLATGTPFRFELVSYETALSALAEWRDGLARIADHLQPVIRSADQINNLLDYNLIDGVVSAADETL